MLLIPKRTKFRKVHKGRVRGTASRGNKLDFGTHGLQALEVGRLTSRQIEAARIAITRKIKRLGKVWIRVFPDVPVTKKPLEVRMGKGKGSVDHYICRVKKDKVLFEINGVDTPLALQALRSGGAKLPIKTKILVK